MKPEENYPSAAELIGQEPAITETEPTTEPTLTLLRDGLLGDQNSFNQFVVDSTHRLKLKALKILKNEAAAEDILQKFYLKIWNKRDYLATRPLTWRLLNTIITNTCLSELKKETRKRKIFSDAPTDNNDSKNLTTPEPSAEEKLMLHEEINQIRNIIKTMDAGDQTILQIQFEGGQSPQQISETTGFHISKVKKAIFKLRSKLGVIIQKHRPHQKPRTKV